MIFQILNKITNNCIKIRKNKIDHIGINWKY